MFASQLGRGFRAYLHLCDVMSEKCISASKVNLVLTPVMLYYHMFMFGMFLAI